MLQHIPPPAILGGADTHMIRDDIQQQPHVVLVERRCKVLKVLFRSQFRIQHTGIHQVIPMHAAGHGFQQGRGVAISDSQSAEVRNYSGGVTKRERMVQLKTIGGERNTRH